MSRRTVPYSVTELEWLEANRTMVISDFHRAFVARFGREDVSKKQLTALRCLKGWKTGRSGHYSAGQSAWNKGLKMPPNPKLCEPRPYRRGVGIGREWIDKDGYVWIVTDQPSPWKPGTLWKRHKHRVLWEQEHGPVPAGHVLKCLGDRQNTDPSNWKLVAVGVAARLSKLTGHNIDEAPAELKTTIIAIATLEHAISEKRKAKADEAAD
ncbi:MAG: HNH endonuclease [Aquamicrobium sp.]|nr:HNH endonuclease [Aquamicrobium sp.]